MIPYEREISAPNSGMPDPYKLPITSISVTSGEMSVLAIYSVCDVQEKHAG
jgi:hypothetical protein